MIASRWQKVLNDLASSKTRTVLIVLSIAVGLFALGVIASARQQLASEMARSFAAIHPSSGTVRTLQPFDQDFIASVRAMPDVAAVDARRVLQVRLQTASGQWFNLQLFAVADYNDMRVNIIFPTQGAWPPPDREILIERAALPVIQAQVGELVTLEFPNEQRRPLRIAGLVHDMAQLPAQFDNSPYGYVSFETLEWFGEPYGFNELHIVASRPQDKAFAQQVVNRVKTKAERTGLVIPMVLAAEPGQLPLDDILQAVLMLLGVLGVLALFLSVFLIINTVSALLAQQRRQVGVMKAIGASTAQVLSMYLLMVALYGLLALALAVPLSVAGSRALSQFMAAMFNFDLAQTRFPPQVALLQVAIGLVLPVLASLYPLLANLRLSAAAAMSAYQAGQGRFGRNWIDRLLSGARLWFARRLLLRPLLLSLRNTFRSKGRLALTLLTLSLASAVFISVFSLRTSLDSTLDNILQFFNFDTMITFERPYRMQKITSQAQAVPGVLLADAWMQLPVRYVRPDDSESGTIYMFAPRVGAQVDPIPSVLQGRWLHPADQNAIVVNAILANQEPSIRLGEESVFKIKGQETRLRVVGIASGVLMPIAYANYPYIARLTGSSGRADTALIVTRAHAEPDVRLAIHDLEDQFAGAGLRVASIQTILDERRESGNSFNVIVSLLFVMSFLLALVGGLGLMGTMSINVLERTREIGVLRAIGASSRGVAQVFVREGLAIGLLSWLLGALLSLPLSRALSDALGIALMGVPMTYNFSMSGLWLWLALVLMLSALASYLPARSASRLTVRETLAYE
ncbi:MAG: ABC transporter permease [Chloroflexota bacterium]